MGKGAFSGPKSAAGAAAVVVFALLLAVPPVGAVKDETILVSRQSAAGGGLGADGSSYDAGVSYDGRYVAFTSYADNLSSEDDNAYTNVFVRDVQAGTTVLVSRQSAGDGGAGADGDSSLPTISGDGRYVVFLSFANNLSTVDNDAYQNVFVRDLLTNTTTLVSRRSATDGGAGADSFSWAAAIASDGRHVAFSSDANNLSSEDNDGFSNVFVRDLQTNTTSLASRQSAGDGGAGANGSSLTPSISGDGRYVAFLSNADNLSVADNDAYDNIFVRDTQTSTTILASRQSAADGAAGADGNSDTPWVSADGRFVAFASAADNLSAGDDNGVHNVLVRDLQTNTTTLVSRQSAADGGAGANGGSYQPSVSADGRYIAFESDADNLSSADDDAQSNVFLRDTQANVTILVSRQSAVDGGAGADDGSGNPAVSADGRYVAFQSYANNLSAADDDGLNVFLRDVLGDTTPPDLDLIAKKRQRVEKPVKVKATCDEACDVVIKGKVKIAGGGTRKLKKKSADLEPGETDAFKLKLPPKAARALEEAGRGVARITGTATDGEGNTATDTVKVKLL